MTRPTPPRGLAAALTAARTTTAGAPRGRRLVGMVLLAWLPVLVQVLRLTLSDSSRGAGFAGFAQGVTGIYLMFIVPLTMIFLGTAAFGDEWASGTAHYVVGLPVSRGALVVGRWFAAARRGLLFVLPPLLTFYVTSMLGFEDAMTHYLAELGTVVLVVTFLVLAYAAVFLLFGVFLRRAVMTSFLYVFLFEMLTANLPQSFAAFSMSFQARNILFQATGMEAFRLPTTNLLAVEPLPLGASIATIATIGAGALLLATLALRSKESGGEVAAADAAST